LLRCCPATITRTKNALKKKNIPKKNKKAQGQEQEARGNKQDEDEDTVRDKNNWMRKKTI
jgi:hypothetical protein